MHKVQAAVLADIVNYIQDKTGDEPTLGSILENTAGELEISLHFTIARSYPAIGSKTEKVK